MEGIACTSLLTVYDSDVNRMHAESREQDERWDVVVDVSLSPSLAITMST